MNKYEILYIIDNEIAEEAKLAVIEKIEGFVTNNGGTIENVDKWGTKRFAYPIDYKKDGYYVLMNFNANSNVPAIIENNVKIMEATIRCMIIRK